MRIGKEARSSTLPSTTRDGVGVACQTEDKSRRYLGCSSHPSEPQRITQYRHHRYFARVLGTLFPLSVFGPRCASWLVTIFICRVKPEMVRVTQLRANLSPDGEALVCQSIQL
jgi:hypothetical protein